MKRSTLRRGLVALAAAAVLWSSVASAQPRHRPPPPPDRHHGGHAEVKVDIDVNLRAETKSREEAYWRLRVKERRDRKIWVRRRHDRAQERRAYLRATWGVNLHRPAVRAELALHADRMARLHRIADVGEESHDRALVVRTNAVIEAENTRHVRAMAELRARGEL
jgi:hypothetical protein